MKARSLTTVADLLGDGLVTVDEADGLSAVAERYAIAVTKEMADLIDPTDARDPIALQLIPSTAELLRGPDEDSDPIGDNAHSPVKGIVHRYPDRVLLKAVHVCPVYCRFCFRREMVGPSGDGTLSGHELEVALAYIAQRPEIWEVILTGGDPLMLSPRRMRQIMTALADIPHVKIVRLHSRVPVADPQRVDHASIEAIKACGKTAYVAIHANHPRELTPSARAAIAGLADAGIVLVSQTVLLKGVNDNVETLSQLMRDFVALRIRPYYLHHPDLAPGTGHFRLSIAEGQALVKALRGRLSGLCQPTYVLDIPGGFGKAVIADATLRTAGDGYLVTDYKGREHVYPPVPKPQGS